MNILEFGNRKRNEEAKAGFSDATVFLKYFVADFSW